MAENVINRVINKFGVIAVIFCVISLFLPWWEMYASASRTVEKATIEVVSVNIWVYPYQVSAKNYPAWAIPFNVFPFGFFALGLLIGGVMLGIAGSVLFSDMKELLFLSELFILGSIIMFILWLYLELIVMASSRLMFNFTDGQYRLVPCSQIGIFSDVSFIYNDTTISYSTFLSIGFWLTIISAIIMFIALKKQPFESKS